MEKPPAEQGKPPVATRERRDDARHHYEMSLALQILFPEETFTPVTYDCKSHDVSLRGMRIVHEQLPLSVYLKLLMTPRYTRLSFTNAFNGEIIKLTGRIVWIDYRKPIATEPGGLCYLAVSFEERENHDLTPYMEFVRGIHAHYPVGV